MALPIFGGPMKKSRLDRQQDFLLNFLRPLVYIWMRLDAKRKVTAGEGVNFKRKEPFVMLANHTFLFDVVHVPLRFRNVPFIIASQTLFTKQPAKFFVTQVAHVIPKSKGKSDMQTIRKTFEVVSKGYPILIFPEGDTTFFGETGYIEPSTMKLVKKLGLDIITCNVKGGYYSKPRWATGKRKNRQVELDYQLTIPKEELKSLSVEDISQRINQALYHNAYLYQQEKRIPHPGKTLAEGIENVIYVCPKCRSLNSFESHGNEFHCTSCKTQGTIDSYGFIQGFEYDNLIAWNQFQRQFRDALLQSEVSSSGLLSYLKVEDESQVILGNVDVVYRNQHLEFSGSFEAILPIEDITNATITLRRDLGFTYQEKNYLIKMDRYAQSFLRILQDKY